MAKRRLSEQQQRRIRRHRRAKTDGATDSDCLRARVVSHHGRKLVAEVKPGERHRCVIRQNLGDIACGDFVCLQPRRHGGKQEYVVNAVEARTNLLCKTGFGGAQKPVAANIDQVLIINAVQPGPNSYLIDRYLVACENLPANACIVFNKCDRLEADDTASDTKNNIDALSALYTDIGYTVLHTSAKTGQGIDALKQTLCGQTGILVGLSGTGKSSLVKALLPEVDIRIGETSAATGEGRHTTTVSALYHLPEGGSLIDSPGVRDFTPVNHSIDEISRGFIDLYPLSRQCRFSDCRHLHEPGCAVRAAVETHAIHPQRLENFHHMLQEFNERHQ